MQTDGRPDGQMDERTHGRHKKCIPPICPLKGLVKSCYIMYMYLRVYDVSKVAKWQSA